MESSTILWERTKNFMRNKEEELVNAFITFLREVTKRYLKKCRRVYFRENEHTHWGEGGFGWLIIEGTEDVYDVFGEYIVGIEFESK